MPFAIDEAKAMLAGVFPPWIAELRLEPLEIGPATCRFRMPANAALVHAGGVVSGQASMAAADTCGVVALAAASGRVRMCSTTDLTASFLRPLAPGDCEIATTLLSNGRRMAVLRADISAAGSPKIAVAVQATYAYLED